MDTSERQLIHEIRPDISIYNKAQQSLFKLLKEHLEVVPDDKVFF